MGGIVIVLIKGVAKVSVSLRMWSLQSCVLETYGRVEIDSLPLDLLCSQMPCFRLGSLSELGSRRKWSGQPLCGVLPGVRLKAD